MRRRRFEPGLALCLALLTPGLLQAEPPDPPPYYAIRDARVVIGAGATLERATVLVADGLIEAVGADLDIPADAWVVEGEGLTLYPGLIDALSTLGQKAAEDSGEGGGGRPTQPRGPEDRPRTTPWVSAADLLAEDGKVEKWREAGFAAAITVPDDGFFAGQAALIHLGDSRPEDRVLATGLAQRLAFGPRGGFGSYPSSLMGTIAYVKQVLSDTRHYMAASTLYESSPAGRERPQYDRTLMPLADALRDGTPFLLPGDVGREVDRSLALAAEYRLPAVIYGGEAGYARVERLKAARTPVLVGLDWPEESKDRDPEADTDFRDLYHRRMAPTTPKALADAGVPFALHSDGLASPSKIFENLRKAIDEGLDADTALAALTSSPAEIFGVADRVGTIERGKIANLVLATAEPWAEEVEVHAVFVDGRKYSYEQEEEEEADPPASNVSGTWALSLETPRGSREMTVELEMDDEGKVTGELSSERGSRTVEDGRMSGDLLRFKTTQTMGDRTMEASYSLTISEESAAGTMSAGPMTMDLSGERTAKAEEEAAGEEDDDEPEVTIDELRAVMAVAQGPVREMGDWAVTNATVYTLAGETIENGTVVVSDGKITAVGAVVRIPSGAEVIDAGGGSLIPGVIDAHSHIAGEGGLNEGSLSVTSMVSVGDVLDPDQISIYRALAGGVTSANILHGSSNPIGGQNAIIKLRWGADADGLRFKGAPAGIKFALGENPKRSNFRSERIPQRYPATRLGVMDVIRQAFTEARDYQREWQEYESARRAGRRPMPPRRDFKLEALVEILDGDRLVHSHCYRADEILQLMRLAEEFGFKIATLQHVLEGYKVADEIAAHGAGGSTFSDWWGYKVEAYDAIPHNAALMAERGVLVSINSDSSEEMRHLNQEAAKAVKWGGMDELEALKLVTLNPAIQLGIDDRVGSIEVGKDADLVLYDGHPLSMLSVVQKTFVDGDLYFDREADRERQAKIDGIKARLMPKDDEEETEEDGEDESEEGEGSSPPPELAWEHEYTCREVGR